MLYADQTSDFNINLFNTDTHQPTKHFLEMILSNNLLPLICHPTRVLSTSATLIDNIFTNVTAKCERSDIVYSGVSDHFPIAIQCNLSTKPKISISVRKQKFNIDNIDKFKNLLSIENWGSVIDACNHKDQDLGYCHFLEVYLNFFNKSFPVTEPLRSKKHFFQKKWITPAVVKLFVVKLKLYNQFILFPTIVNESKLKKYRNKLKSLLKAAKKSNYTEIFANCGI